MNLCIDASRHHQLIRRTFHFNGIHCARRDSNIDASKKMIMRNKAASMAGLFDGLVHDDNIDNGNVWREINEVFDVSLKSTDIAVPFNL